MKYGLLILLMSGFVSYTSAQDRFLKKDSLPKRDTIIPSPENKKDSSGIRNKFYPDKKEKGTIPKDDADPKVKPNIWRDTIMKDTL